MTESFVAQSKEVFPGPNGGDIANDDRLRQLLEEAEVAAGLDLLEGSKSTRTGGSSRRSGETCRTTW